MHFADRLNRRIVEENSHLVIGIDPDPNRIFSTDSKFLSAFTNHQTEYILDVFCALVLDVAVKTACAVKPQVAFFESMGLCGWKVLSRCIRKARSMGIPVILDAKRGDIGNTAASYARAYLDPSSEFFADALTVNPYMGSDTLEPFIKMATQHNAGIFILVKTSNPGSGELQDLVLQNGQKVSTEVARMVDKLGKASIGNCGYSNVGAVIGATYPDDLENLRTLLPRSIILLPGFGVQGGTAKNVEKAFDANGKGAVVASSRGIIFAYEKTSLQKITETDIFNAMWQAAEKARMEIGEASKVTSSI